MWYIIKTDYYKEREAIKDLLQLDGITDIYFFSQMYGFREALVNIIEKHSTIQVKNILK